MNKKIVIILAILLVSSTAFMADNASAGDISLNPDPNVAALQAARGAPPCYLDPNTFNCEKNVHDEGCAACDDEIVVTPDISNK